MTQVYDPYTATPAKAKKPVKAKVAPVKTTKVLKSKPEEKAVAEPEYYPAHPLADMFPMIDEPERILLADDIAAHGQHEPILLLEGMVLGVH